MNFNPIINIFNVCLFVYKGLCKMIGRPRDGYDLDLSSGNHLGKCGDDILRQCNINAMWVDSAALEGRELATMRFAQHSLYLFVPLQEEVDHGRMVEIDVCFTRYKIGTSPSTQIISDGTQYTDVKKHWAT